MQLKKMGTHPQNKSPHLLVGGLNFVRSARRRSSSRGKTAAHSGRWRDKLDFNYITDGIYIGTNQCCQTHFDENLKKDGVSTDISMEDERIDAPFGVEFYVWIPVKNHTAPTKDQLEFGVSVLEKIIAMRKKVYVHCQNGHGRAPTLVAALLIKQGKTTDEAIELIKSKRPSIHLTDAQKESLKMWGQSVRR